jgi:hypothetical protein
MRAIFSLSIKFKKMFIIILAIAGMHLLAALLFVAETKEQRKKVLISFAVVLFIVLNAAYFAGLINLK